MGPLFDAVTLPLLLVGLGYLAGRYAERRHYESIRTRERGFLAVPNVTGKTLQDPRPVQDAQLAVGSVVVSVDYFKRLLTTFRQLFGGEIASYASLLDRARREAILRMKESCPQADLFLNCRLETATIFSGRRGATGSVEVVAYGTAVWFVQ